MKCQISYVSSQDCYYCILITAGLMGRGFAWNPCHPKNNKCNIVSLLDANYYILFLLSEYTMKMFLERCITKKKLRSLLSTLMMLMVKIIICIILYHSLSAAGIISVVISAVRRREQSERYAPLTFCGSMCADRVWPFYFCLVTNHRGDRNASYESFLPYYDF